MIAAVSPASEGAHVCAAKEHGACWDSDGNAALKKCLSPWVVGSSIIAWALGLARTRLRSWAIDYPVAVGLLTGRGK